MDVFQNVLTCEPSFVTKIIHDNVERIACPRSRKFDGSPLDNWMTLCSDLDVIEHKMHSDFVGGSLLTQWGLARSEVAPQGQQWNTPMNVSRRAEVESMKRLDSDAAALMLKWQQPMAEEWLRRQPPVSLSHLKRVLGKALPVAWVRAHKAVWEVSVRD